MNDLQSYAYAHPFTRATPLAAGHYRLTRHKDTEIAVALSVNK